MVVPLSGGARVCSRSQPGCQVESSKYTDRGLLIAEFFLCREPVGWRDEQTGGR
jgi:hypothetical protein